MKVLHSICQQIWKTQQWPQDCKRSVFIPIPKKGSAKECSDYHTIALISHTSNIMLKTLQVMFQLEVPYIEVGFRKGRGTKDQLTNIHWITEKVREFQKNICFCVIDYAKAFDLWITTNWNILKEMGIPDHHTCLLRNRMGLKKQLLELYMEQLTGSKLGKEYVKAIYCHLAYLTSEYIMRNVLLDKLEGEIKIARRNINNLRFADDTTLMAESEEEHEEEIKSLLMTVKEESEKVGLKISIKKRKKEN